MNVKKAIYRGILAVGILFIMSAANVSHAASGGWQSFLEDRYKSAIASVMEVFGYSQSQWQETGSTYYQSGYGDANHAYLSQTFKDSAGNVLTIEYCLNAYFSRITQTACTSAPNKCGMTGTGFITDNYWYSPGNWSGHLGYHEDCTARVPSDSLCPATNTNNTNNNNANLNNSNNNGSTGGNGSSGSNQTNSTVTNTCVPTFSCRDAHTIVNSCTGATMNCGRGATCQNGVCVPDVCVPIYSCRDAHTIQNSCDSTTIRCTGSQVCSGGVCITPAPAVTSFGSHSGHLEAHPSAVQKNTPTTLFWNTSNVVANSCAVRGTNGDEWLGRTFSGEKGVSTSPIGQMTTYTLTCTGINGATFMESRMVNVLPNWEER